MKFLLSIAAVLAVAAAVPTQRGLIPIEPGGPVIDPEPTIVPVAVGPAIIAPVEPVESVPIIDPIEPFPVSVGPELITPPESVAVGPAIIVPAPAVVEPTPAATTPLVQIILNINQAAEARPVAVSPVVAPEPVFVVPNPTPVSVVDVAPEPVHAVDVVPEPVQVVEVAPVPVEPVQIGVPVIPEPVQIGVPVIPEPVQIGVPVIPEPVQVGVPIIPSPAVAPEDQLN